MQTGKKCLDLKHQLTKRDHITGQLGELRGWTITGNLLCFLNNASLRSTGVENIKYNFNTNNFKDISVLKD